MQKDESLISYYFHLSDLITHLLGKKKQQQEPISW